MKWYRIKLTPDSERYDEYDHALPFFVVTSPDIPGLVTDGETLAVAILNAYEAAGLLLNDDNYNFRLEII